MAQIREMIGNPESLLVRPVWTRGIDASTTYSVGEGSLVAIGEKRRAVLPSFNRIEVTQEP